MLRTDLIHPQLLAALAGAGHGSTVLLADGHYPASTAVGPNATIVHLNLTPGVLDVSSVLEPLLTLVPWEAATVMVPPSGDPEPPAVTGYRQLLSGLEFHTLDRFAFYSAAAAPELALAVVTADIRTYATCCSQSGFAGSADHPPAATPRTHAVGPVATRAAGRATNAFDPNNG